MTRKITRINQIAIEKPNEVFTSIYHIINQDLLYLNHFVNFVLLKYLN